MVGGLLVPIVIATFPDHLPDIVRLSIPVRALSWLALKWREGRRDITLLRRLVGVSGTSLSFANLAMTLLQQAMERRFGFLSSYA